MLYACTTSLLLIVGRVLFHYEALRHIGAAAVGVRQQRRAGLVVIFGAVAVHRVEILVPATSSQKPPLPYTRNAWA